MNREKTPCITKGKNVRRWYVNKFGPLPPEKLLCHLCNNPYCHNIDHIYLGTPSSNAQDYIDTLGLKPHPNSFLTRDQILEIRASNELWRILAKRYNVSYYTIQHIKRGETYRYIV